MFVDRDVALRDRLRAGLCDELDIHTAGSGEEALTIAATHRPEIVVTEVVLPGMDGIELVRALRDRPSIASVPILMTSTRAAEQLHDGFELGVDAYLDKPYTETALRARIRGMLNNARVRTDALREQLRIESERRETEERAALLESITEAFYALDHEWRITYLNQRAIDYFGLPKEALLGRVFYDLFPQMRDTIAHREGERVVREQVSASLEFRSPVSGRWLEVHAYPHRHGMAVNFRDISDRKRADALLRESEARLRLMSDALPALVSYVDRDYRYQFCNRKYEEWFGVTSADIVGRTLPEVLGETAFATLKPSVDRALAGETFTLETRVPYRTGGTRHVHIDYLPVSDEEGGVVRGYYAFVQDITERKAAELRLRESEARFRSLADNAPVMVRVTETDGECSFLSRSWYEFTGQTADKALGMGWLRAVHPADAVQASHLFHQANAQHQPFRLEYRLRRANGEYAWVIDAASPRFNDVGEFLGLVGSIIDIQERREVEERLRTLNDVLEQRVADVLAERKLFADVVEGTDAFVQVIDRNFRWLAINRASVDQFEKTFGVRPKVGESMLELLADQPERQAALKAMWTRALAGEEFSEVHEYNDRAQQRLFYEMKFSSLRDRSGNQVGAYQFAFDVTQRIENQARLQEAQDALRQSQKMETLGQLTGGVAHDFNNLLTPIVGALDLLSRKYEGDGRAQRLTSSALQAADRAKTLIQRLLAFARRQHLESRPVDLHDLLDGIRDFLARTLGPRIELSIQVDSGLPPVSVDPNQLELALLNLAVNARDAMPEGGLLIIRVVEEANTPARLPLDRYVRVSVQDNGLGMDVQTLSRAIEPFFTTKGIGQGTGLGLSMVHGLAAQSGGDFTLESEVGHGTIAQLWLPVSREIPAQTYTTHEASNSAHLSMSTVLLVDDEPLVRIGTAAMLLDGGYNVVEASSADEALRLFHNGLKVDAVITDFAMPGRTGTQLVRELKADGADLPVLLITGFASLTEEEAGDVPRLNKPFRQTELLTALAEVMAAASARSRE